MLELKFWRVAKGPEEIKRKRRLLIQDVKNWVKEMEGNLYGPH